MSDMNLISRIHPGLRPDLDRMRISRPIRWRPTWTNRWTGLDHQARIDVLQALLTDRGTPACQSTSGETDEEV
jgi:hypothetical protein